MLKQPKLIPVKLRYKNNKLTQTLIESYKVLLLVIPDSGSRKLVTKCFSKNITTKLNALKKGEMFTFTLNNKNLTQVVVSRFSCKSRYENLVWSRNFIEKLSDKEQEQVGLHIEGEESQINEITEVVYLAASAKNFKLNTYFSKKNKKPAQKSIKSIDVLQPINKELIKKANAYISGNNLARWLTALPPNILDAKNYIQFIKSYAQEQQISFEFFSEKKLRILNAGAFLAVSQGNKSRDAGIVKLTYTGNPDNQSLDLALVGKGIIFDTGGNNLKPFQYMLDMHIDMEGSAVALGLFHALKELKVNLNVEVWLAITENRISSNSYKSQDIITASNGTTIQAIHTDAEGRMVLADTLALACKSKPDWILDFATLTGACESALTTKYAGVFTNKMELHENLIAAGSISGERVWPFPMDADFLELIESDIADVKQCSESGGGDHIAASKFLEKFVSKEITWVHTDLSSGYTKNGLAHIPTRVTGFGIGFGLELLKKSGKI